MRNIPFVKDFKMPSNWINTAQNWAQHTALPFWASVGVDDVSGGFHERLNLKGEPIHSVSRRLMVQARQTYVFAHAYTLGWLPQGADLAARGVNHMIAKYYKADGQPGWVHSIDAQGKVTNPARDAYAHAFVLYALGWAYHVTQDKKILAIIDETLVFLDSTLAHKTYGGFQDAVPAPDEIRRQNPHMHMFEAFLSLYEATGQARFLARAGEIYGLFTARFFNHEQRILPEYFDSSWSPLVGDTGQIFEPGHHFEWAWLMRKFQDLSGRDVSPYATALVHTANKYGFDESTGLIYDEVLANGRVYTPSHRSWPHTEAIKANAAEHEYGAQGCLARVEAIFETLFTHFIGKPIAAGWVDHIEPTSKAKTDVIPASTLYHVFLCIAEADRVFGAGKHKNVGVA